MNGQAISYIYWWALSVGRGHSIVGASQLHLSHELIDVLAQVAHLPEDRVIVLLLQILRLPNHRLLLRRLQLLPLIVVLLLQDCLEVVLLLILIIIVVAAGAHQRVEICKPLHDLLHIHLVIIVVIVVVAHGVARLLASKGLLIEVLGLLQLSFSEINPTISQLRNVRFHIFLISMFLDEEAEPDDDGHVAMSEVLGAFMGVVGGLGELDQGLSQVAALQKELSILGSVLVLKDLFINRYRL
mmetsp:Transcript_10344/g.10365  ORF Transcript_10344/g.10365 Transcript_10344/m.10365 type:complete len:242 (+) Transcript_10344:18-743(+)